MATAALRAVLVVAAVVLGVFVLSRAFPAGEDAATPTAPDQPPTTPPASPSPTEAPAGGGGGGQPEARDPSQVRIQVLNGTDVSGLAAETQVALEEGGYRVVSIDDAEEKPVERTEIAFRANYRRDAQVLQGQFFPEAQLQEAAPDIEAHITVTLGVDYAEAQEA